MPHHSIKLFYYYIITIIILIIIVAIVLNFILHIFIVGKFFYALQAALLTCSQAFSSISD